ncbi:MAG: MotA/TolQ/ExbB proton channel family protein [Chitinispirillales bacterium]|jgi:biopolymer transport protein ExbB/TolQ|nr:MotA/TolQ/ExbB proton channel family protein [Chitinispirillales bacterium]
MGKYIGEFALFFKEGGEFMWIISAVFGFAVAIVIERLIFMYVTCANTSAKAALEAAKALEADDKKEIEKLCKRNDPLSILLNNAINKFKKGVSINEIRNTVEEDAILQIPRIYSRLNYLALVANAVTLLGLLGTIQGLQMSFSSLASLEAAEKATALSKGISVAMNTTALGLVTAIPCMFAFTFLSNKKQNLINSIDDAMARFLNFLEKPK